MAAKQSDALAEIQAAFSLFDVGNEGSISADDLAKTMRCIGMTPSLAEVQRILDDLGKSGSKQRITFNEFMKIVSQRPQKPEGETELLEAFSIFDRDGSGFIDSKQLRYTLTNLGEILTEKEVDEMMAELAVDDDGQINYRNFVREMCNYRDRF